jgi:tRNA threonylcarbamoyladenosine biosynthesis protein TsaE
MLTTLRLQSRSEEDTIAIGALIGAAARAGDVILLHGALGAGKTCLAKGIVSAVAGVSVDEVVSPTFTLINSFEGPVAAHHADFYRIGPHDVDDLGLEDAAIADGVLVVEWADRVDEGLWDDPLRVTITPVEDDEKSRELLLEWRGGPEARKRIADRASRRLDSAVAALGT